MSFVPGDLVSFSYGFMRDNIPADIKIKHVRHDISWQELIRRYHDDEMDKDHNSNNQPHSKVKKSSKPLGIQQNQGNNLSTRIYITLS